MSQPWMRHGFARLVRRYFLGGTVATQREKSSTILVIDDSSTIRRSAEIFLEESGFTVIFAEDGFEALSKVVNHQPAMIFCDISMPRLDGYQTCTLLKQHARYHSIPVIMLTSKDSLFDRVRGDLAGTDDYLTKPFTKDTLLDAVKRFARQT